MNLNWRDVKFKRVVKDVGLVEDETIVSDCEKWIFFGDTMSAGKKNDHVFHNACQTYIINHYDKQRLDSGLTAIPFNIVWTDNCPTQYRCRQNFYHVANAAKTSNHKPIVIHKFAQKYRFKGSWDATGKVVKQKILQNELKYDRCSNAMDCYMKMTRDMTKDGSEKKTQKLLEYERTGDAKVVKNTTFTTIKTHIGYGTEHKQEYTSMIDTGQYKHVVFTDRQDVPDMKPIQGTMLISQVNGTKNTDKESLVSARLPCSCPPCRLNVNEMIQKCEYKSERMIEEHQIIMKNNDEDNTKDDPYGILTLTVTQLKAELLNRGLARSGLKQDLVARLLSDLERNNWETGINNESSATVINGDTACQPLPALPDIVLPPQLLDATVVNGSATDAPAPMGALPDIVLPPQLPDATVINGSVADAPSPMVALPDIVLPPQLPDATVVNGSATAPSIMVALPDIVLPPHLPDATVVNGSATAPSPMVALPDIVLHPHLPDAAGVNGSATAPSIMVALPDIVPPPHLPIPHLLHFDLLNVKQLKEQLLVRRLKRVGNKAALVARLKEYLERNNTNPDLH